MYSSSTVSTQQPSPLGREYRGFTRNDEKANSKLSNVQALVMNRTMQTAGKWRPSADMIGATHPLLPTLKLLAWVAWIACPGGKPILAGLQSYS